jgi:hypothetical protein
MWTEWDKGTDEGYEKSEQTARALLAYADLPLLYRVHACMTLGCTPSSAWAREGLRTMELSIQSTRDKGGEPSEPELKLLEACKTVLRNAEAAEEEFDEEVEQDKEDEEDEEDEDEEPAAIEQHAEPAAIEREPPRRISAADRLAIQEGASFTGQGTGMATPAASRTASGDSPQASQARRTTQARAGLRTGLATPGVSRTTSRTASGGPVTASSGNPGRVVRRRTSLRLSRVAEDDPEEETPGDGEDEDGGEDGGEGGDGDEGKDDALGGEGEGDDV